MSVDDIISSALAINAGKDFRHRRSQAAAEMEQSSHCRLPLIRASDDRCFAPATFIKFGPPFHYPAKRVNADWRASYVIDYFRNASITIANGVKYKGGDVAAR